MNDMHIAQTEGRRLSVPSCNSTGSLTTVSDGKAAVREKASYHGGPLVWRVSEGSSLAIVGCRCCRMNA
ncbi:unnamed protein product [Enterobius vermicularis]|uniref:Myotubularin phosphatase domain-containing protein n=1 Tax=Enterobius vermicularis TaxID=51028 RepID=A0A0N4VAW7_ENTVE|nr:unnamed protein product [Enterobius vermicularis]